MSPTTFFALYKASKTDLCRNLLDAFLSWKKRLNLHSSVSKLAKNSVLQEKKYVRSHIEALCN